MRNLILILFVFAGLQGQAQLVGYYKKLAESQITTTIYYTPQDQPASTNEGTTMTDWEAFRSATVEMTGVGQADTDKYDGSYAILVTSGAQTYSNAQIYFANCVIGESYEIKFRAKSGTYNPSSAQQIQFSDTGGWTVSAEISITTSTWDEYTIVREADSTTPKIAVRANRSVATANQELFIDIISLTLQ